MLASSLRSNGCTASSWPAATDRGPGRDGKEGCGSTTEQMQGEIAAAIYAHCHRMNNAQLEEIIGWVKRYKTN